MSPLPLRSINHIGRLTKHLDASKAFYRDVLGFEEIVRPNFNFSGAWLYKYGLQLHLIVDEAIGDAQGEIRSRDNHLAFEADDLQEIERILKEKNIPHRVQFQADTNRKQIFFRDPDGHHIEVGTYAAAVPLLP